MSDSLSIHDKRRNEELLFDFTSSVFQLTDSDKIFLYILILFALTQYVRYTQSYTRVYTRINGYTYFQKIMLLMKKFSVKLQFVKFFERAIHITASSKPSDMVPFSKHTRKRFAACFSREEKLNSL